ncbi:MAG: DUF2452 domain-containing protein [Bacteroidota bacterium]
MDPNKEEQTSENPIDKDKITDIPSLLPYPHTIGSALVTPVDKGKVKGKAVLAMEEQTHIQMDQIKEQIELLAKQARALQDRVDISYKIYQADIGFEPAIGQIYHLYERTDDQWVLSLVAPSEWGRRIPFQSFLATVRLLADHTWELQDRDSL